MTDARITRNRPFMGLWLAQSVDEIGSALGSIALVSVAVLDVHAGPLQIGIMMMLRFTVMPIAGVVSAPLIRRHSPRRIMQISYLIRAVALAGLPSALVLHVLTIWLIFIVVIIDGACSSVFAVGFDATLPIVVPSDQLGSANARAAVSQAIGPVAGPGAGGLAAQLVGPAVSLFANVGGFVVAAFALFRLSSAAGRDRGTSVAAPAMQSGTGQRDAWRLIRQNPTLRAVVSSRAASNVGGGVIEANLLVFLFGSGQSPGRVGIMLAVAETGGFLGVFLASRGARTMSVRVRMVVLPALMGLGMSLVPSSLTTPSAVCDASISRGHAAGSIVYPGAEVGPMAAADPTTPQHLIAVAQQDRWNDGGSNAINALTSDNGGRSWTLADSRPPFSICAGAQPGTAGHFDRTSDTWVSVGPDGVAYQTALAFNLGGPGFGGASAVEASRSTDGGRHWGRAVTLTEDANPLDLNDKDAVTADPINAGHAYAVWDRLHFATQDAYKHDPNSFSGPTLFSTTRDGGATWSAGRVIYDPGPRAQTFDNQLLVVPGGPDRGALVDAFLLIKNPSTPYGADDFTLATLISHDGGSTWTGPNAIAPMEVPPPDPARPGSLLSEVNVRSLGESAGVHGDIFPNFTVDPGSGALYATWQGWSPDHAPKVALSRSTDGGVHWTTPARIDRSPGESPTFLPQIHVASDGTVGVAYYDLRAATTLHPGLTDVYLARCSAAMNDCSAPGNWSETRVTRAGPFDLTTTLVVYDRYFLGDYMALTTSGSTFVVVYAASAPMATGGATDMFTSRVS